VAEGTEKSFAIRGDQEARKTQRNTLVGEYVAAKGDARARILRRINDWNKGQPDNAHIKFKDLTAAEKRQKDEVRKGTYENGVRYTTRDKDLKSTNDVYNVSP
jgi:hypothetical protein